uniref:Uncharacterized protein n=1 Tax=Panagrolaimus sp. PS1159 TaxID=55785 RepID=A0AC35FUN2_9BILA
MFSQVSGTSNGSSGSERRRMKAVLPPPPSSIQEIPYGDGANFFRQQSANFYQTNYYPSRAMSRQSFRIACGNQTSEEYFIENI